MATEHAPSPGIIMVARGTEPVALALGAAAVIGRTLVAGDGTAHEIADERMSREHARVRFERGRWEIADLASRNGTFVGAQRIAGVAHRHGDAVLRCGHSVFVLLADASGHPAALDAALGPELQRAHDRIRSAAAAGEPVWLCGAATDNEAAARGYHAASARRAGPFVPVSCAALPDGVAERLLFGAKRGVVESIGHFQMADGGTLYLDDIAALGPAVQIKLLRVIESRAVEPVGATMSAPIDVGIVAGAHGTGPDERIDPGLARRLGQARVQLPELRDRRVEIARVLQRELARLGKQPHAKLVEACLVRDWPGSTGELVTAIAEAAAIAAAQQRDVVRADDLAATAGLSANQRVAETAVDRGRRDTPPADIDRAQIEAALIRAHGVVHIAARILGVHRTQLRQLMDQYGIADDAE